MRLLLPVAVAVLAAACSSSSSPTAPADSGSPGNEGGGVDAGGDVVVAEAGGEAGAKIEHVVVIVQENHTFDSYFGNWCTAATGSSPTCTTGAACCEKAPTVDPGSSAMASVLNDAFNAGRDPNHTQKCEVSEIDNGKMDMYATSTVSSPGAGASECGSPDNLAIADSTVQGYWTFAQQGALADRYFQPMAGASSGNDMYLARAQYVFTDNDYEPIANGATCSTNGTTMQYTDTTIGDLLNQAGVSWAWYSEGYAAMQAAVATGTCPPAPADCAFGNNAFDCVYDPSDDPFEYYKDLVDNPSYARDYGQLATDLSAGKLPSVVFVKALLYKTEHPGYMDTVSAGVTFVTDTVNAIQASSAASSTLILVTWDEGGGFFDHVAPPATNTVDSQPYGTRLPLIAIGPFARTGSVSHTTMEHSSIVKFIEYNWLGGTTGQLKGRDANVANIGSMLTAGLVPEN
jgi:phospholipase C